MRRLSTKLYVLIGTGLLAAMAGAVHAQNTVKIGLVLSYKGAYASVADSVDKGFELALQELGGQVRGTRIEIVRVDDELTPNVAIQKFNKLVHGDRVNIVAGVIHSGVGIAFTELAEKTKTPLVLSLAFADEITGKYCNPYVARTSHSANAFHYAGGQYWAKQGRKTAVTMGPDYAAGHAFINAFKRGFEDSGGKVVSQLWSPFQTTKDWSGYLASAKTTKADFIYAFFAGAEAVQVVKQHAELGLRTSMPLIGDQFLYDQSLWPAWGDLVAGTRHLATHSPDLPSEASRNFVDAFQKKHGSIPDVYAELGYTNAKAILLALGKTGGSVGDGASFIRTLTGIQFAAPRGIVRFAKNNNAVLEKVYLVEIVKGTGGTLTRKTVDTMPGASDLPGCALARN
jgi:branched-chain amino acid transport system substrate-binding protein